MLIIFVSPTSNYFICNLSPTRPDWIVQLKFSQFNSCEEKLVANIFQIVHGWMAFNVHAKQFFVVVWLFFILSLFILTLPLCLSWLVIFRNPRTSDRLVANCQNINTLGDRLEMRSRGVSEKGAWKFLSSTLFHSLLSVDASQNQNELEVRSAKKKWNFSLLRKFLLRENYKGKCFRYISVFHMENLNC